MAGTESIEQLRALFREEMQAAGTAARGGELLQRAALMRWFDARIYGDALTPGLKEKTPPPSFDDFVRDAAVGVLSQREGTYAIRDGAREQLLTPWREDRNKLKRFSGAMVEYFEKRKSMLDVFAFQIFATPAKAREEFMRLYTAADKKFDMATCDSLLRIVRNRGELRGRQLTEALNDREQYFQSRSLFADEWVRTAHFLERKELAREVNAFLRADDERWALRMVAPGGAGKTAFLRWLIARRCVVERGAKGTRIPVARVDLDYVHLPAIEKAPWLVLVTIADQLNAQLEGAPFRTFLLDNRRFLSALQRPVSRDTEAPLPDFDAWQADLVREKFAACLLDDRVLVIIDTMEELVLHHPAVVAELIGILHRVSGDCSGMKTVLSGRYDAFAHDGATGLEKFKKDTTEVLLEPWTKEECWEYLTKIRKMTPAMTFPKFAVPGGGNPFKVSLFADLIGVERPFTLQDVRELRRLEVEYLVERIIERIPQAQCALRWLLRYAALPRQLTEGFVEQVLAPRLRAAMTASSDLDRPAENLPAGAGILRRRAPWQLCSQAFVTGEQWPALKRYAGSANWIELQGTEPRLKPELVSPMRYLLQEQPIFWEIHKDAVAYFEKLAQEPGRDWAEMTCEAIFHKFQHEGQAAEIYWLDRLKQPPAMEEGVRRKLVSFLLSGDFLDDGLQPLPHRRTGKLIHPSTLVLANLEMGALDVVADLKAGRLVLGSGAEYLRRVTELERKHGLAPAGGNCRRLLQLANLPTGGVEGVLDVEAGAYASAVWVGIATCVPGKAVLAFEHAAQAARAQSSIFPLPSILNLQVAAARAAGDLETALTAARERLGLLAQPSEEASRQTGEIIQMERECARWSRARETFDGQKQAALDVFDPDGYLQMESGLSGTPTLTPRNQGLVKAMQGDLAVADRLLELAAWGSSSGESVEARVDHLRLLVQDIRNLRKAGSLAGTRDFGEYRIQVEMLLLEMQVASTNRAKAEARWAQLVSEDPDWADVYRVPLLATGLALKLVPASEFDTLLEVLSRFRPATARLPHLKPFALFRGEVADRRGVSKRFQKILPAPPPGDPDFVMQALLLADALRFVGDRNSAASMLKDALKHPSLTTVYLRRQVINAMLRLELVVEAGDLLQYEEEVANTGVPAFRAIVHLELAEWFLKRHDFDRAGDALRSGPPQESSQYYLRYLLAKAELDAGMGNRDAASSLLGEAAGVAEELGIPFVRPTAAGASGDTHGVIVEAENVLQISMPSRRRISLVYTPANGVPMKGEAGTEPLPLFSALERSDPRGLSDVLEEPGRFQKVVEGMIPVKLETGRVGNLRLEFTQDDACAGLPWERVIPGMVYRSAMGRSVERERLGMMGARLRQLDVSIEVGKLPPAEAAKKLEAAQRSRKLFVDGWNGQLTNRNVSDALGRRPVALIKPSAEAERFVKSGTGASGLALDQMYRDYGVAFEAVSPRQLHPKEAAEVLRRANILHIALPVQDNHGLLALGSEGSDGATLSPAFLSERDPSLRRPIVIVDTPMPSRLQLRAQQMVWRNLYGMHLFARGTVDAVILTGLTLVDPFRFEETILKAMLAHLPLAELVRELNKIAPDSDSCLYAWDPGILL